MFFGSPKKRKDAEEAFQRKVDENENLLHDDQPDCLLGTCKVMGTGLTLTNASLMILCEPIYNVKTFTQIPKRAHRMGQLKQVTFAVLHGGTQIERYVSSKQGS